MPAGLLVALSDAPVGKEDEFAGWYDDHHIPVRAALPGWRTAQRYTAVEGEPSHLAYYDLESVEVLEDPAYIALRKTPPPADAAMLAEIPLLERRVYRSLEDDATSPDYAPDEARFLLAVGMTVRPHDVDDLHAWYRQEHIPDLLGLPGWLRARRFERVAGSGPRFLAMHDLQSLDVLTSPAFVQARSTSWRRQIMGKWIHYQRSVYEVVRRFDCAHG
jgi:hypothetical protein